MSQLGVEGKYLQSRQQTDYDKNIEEFVQEGYPLVVTVGFLLGDATKAAAQKNKDTKFAIVDFAYDPKDVPNNNILGLTFQTDQAAFQAGYLAAAMSKTGKVGTFGGIKIPPVTIFMVGFQGGVNYYNQKMGKQVKVLGWDTTKGDGLFTGTFTEPDKGKQAALSLIEEGADVVLPVAGLTGNGAFVAAKEKGVMAMGVDTDQCISVPDACPVLLTSVRKNIDVAVFTAIKSVVDGTFKSGVYVGTLANDGVSIAPFHEFDAKIPADVKSALDQIKADIVAGKIDVQALAKGAAAPPAAAKFTIPDIEAGKFNVGFIYIGPHDDGGWTQAHDIGRQWVEKNVPGVHTAYVELVPEGTESEQVTRALARKGFNVIIGTSFGFMDGMEAVSAEFPDIYFLHVSGYKKNDTNFGNMFGAMEDMKMLAGMIAGARAKADKATKIGYVATFPIPEELRLGNAFALGIQQTCPECKLDVRWINTWHDPVKEKDAAASLFDAGADVVMTGADTPANAEVAKDKGKWAITYDYEGNCKLDSCLTTMYWNWGPVYAADIKAMMNKTWKPGFEYFDADSGGLGLFGFMEGQTPQKGVPADVIPLVKAKLADMLAGKFTRFDVFAGPIVDNTGKTIVPAGAKMEQGDLDQFPGGAIQCKYCMYWWNQNVIAELPKLQ
jgi:basic membrane protein A